MRNFINFKLIVSLIGMCRFKSLKINFSKMKRWCRYFLLLSQIALCTKLFARLFFVCLTGCIKINYADRRLWVTYLNLIQMFVCFSVHLRIVNDPQTSSL